MPTRFEFSTASRVLFGRGAVADTGAAAQALGRRALVVHGRSAHGLHAVLASLAGAGLDTAPFTVSGEPDTTVVTEGAAAARVMRADLVVGVGGGSVIDAAKAVAALATNTAPVHEYLEVVGRGQPLTCPALPVVAVPTTAGTGSEVTRNAVLTSPADRVKVSLRSASMMPRVAIVDPDLTRDLPPSLTATTGMDALTQLIEAYLSIRATPMTDALAAAGIPRAAAALPRAVSHGSDQPARSDMALASLWSGMALANAGLGAVHGFAAPIGGRFPAPHGAVCAVLLPHVFEANARAIEQRGDRRAAERFDAVAQWLTGRSHARWPEGVDWLRAQTAAFRIPPLGTYGVTAADIEPLADQASRASSMKGNPIVLTPHELSVILKAAI